MTVMCKRLCPPMELETPRGRARAHFLMDYGTDTSLVWVCFVIRTGECWCVRNEDVREVRDDTWSLPGGRAVEAAGGPQGAALPAVAAAPVAAAGAPSQPAAAVVPPVGDRPPAAARRVAPWNDPESGWPGLAQAARGID